MCVYIVLILGITAQSLSILAAVYLQMAMTLSRETPKGGGGTLANDVLVLVVTGARPQHGLPG